MVKRIFYFCSYPEVDPFNRKKGVQPARGQNMQIRARDARSCVMAGKSYSRVSGKYCVAGGPGLVSFKNSSDQD